MEKPPSLSPELVNEFVIKSHNDLNRVTELLAQEPALVNASWDWGGGDWETGLGSAAHMGRKDIAEYLLANGARLDLFAAAMLGQLDIVKSIITAHPQMRHAPGPHGIPLIQHARVGDAQNVIAYLESL